MKNDQTKALRALEELLLDDSDLTIEELRSDLETRGVDVDAYLERFSKELRTGFQSQQRRAAEQEASVRINAALRVFGDLAAKTFPQLKALYDQVQSGEYGADLQCAAQARCRNQSGVEPSETELRSWLEDISTSSRQ